jgi:hypothetical protein
MVDGAVPEWLPEEILALFLAEERQQTESPKKEAPRVELPAHIKVLDPGSASKTRREKARQELDAMTNRPELRRTTFKSIATFNPQHAKPHQTRRPPQPKRE